MQHPLDNPAWNALITANKNLGEGTAEVRFFKRDVSPFAGLAENSLQNFRALYNLLPPQSIVAVFNPEAPHIPEPWEIVNPMLALQMVYEREIPPPVTGVTLAKLSDEHIPAMLALTKLTNPGPFFNRTIDFGHYYGIFDSGRMVAMAGRRLQPLPYMEVSAVCNHPDHLGKGYASGLIQHQVRLIMGQGYAPFLHVLKSNENAIRVYEKLGFVTRSEMNIWAIKKA
ncbi:MAG TPA: GNAT family N-acetyltransferase [Mucilaginibacter sp.]